jgi:hypothetical protein
MSLRKISAELAAAGILAMIEGPMPDKSRAGEVD